MPRVTQPVRSEQGPQPTLPPGCVCFSGLTREIRQVDFECLHLKLLLVGAEEMEWPCQPPAILPALVSDVLVPAKRQAGFREKAVVSPFK